MESLATHRVVGLDEAGAFTTLPSLKRRSDFDHIDVSSPVDSTPDKYECGSDK